MTTSQTPGVVSLIKSENTLDPDWEDKIQEWLCEISGLNSDHVIPNYQINKSILSKETTLYYQFGPPQPEGTPIKEVAPDGESIKVIFTNTITLTLYIYGTNARELAQEICDACAVNQSTYTPYQLGLGFIDAKVTASIMDADANGYIPRTDIEMLFNYTYSRTYAVKSITSAAVQITR